MYLNYKNGYCLAFATALQKAFEKAGCRTELFDVVEHKSNGEALPHHVVVKYGKHFYDVGGRRSEQSLLQQREENFLSADYPLEGHLRIEPHSPRRAAKYKLRCPAFAVERAAGHAAAIAKNAIKE
jgi:hypothetical protein